MSDEEKVIYDHIRRRSRDAEDFDETMVLIQAYGLRKQAEGIKEIASAPAAWPLALRAAKRYAELEQMANTLERARATVQREA